MGHFYIKDFNNISNEILLEANPFYREPRINFLGELTPEFFFNHFYINSVDISEGSQNKKVCQFTNNFYETIESTTHNKYAKVDCIHISGYAGCGKTTFIRYLFWNKFHDYDLKYVIDFAGEQHIEDACISALSNLIYTNIYYTKILKWDEFDNIRFFETRRFSNVLPKIYDFISQLEENEFKKNITVNDIIEEFIKFKNFNFVDQKNEYINYLLRFIFIIQLFENIHYNSPMVILFDNVDSIDNIEEERNFVQVLRNFVTDCNYFFGINRNNTNNIHNKPISEIITDFKMICFLTTRIITNNFINLTPDMEEMYGWYSFRLPQNYFNHVAIIDKKINYYLSKTSLLTESKKLELLQLKDFTHNVYKSNMVSRIFNGNIRFSMKSICKIVKYYSNTEILNECSSLISNRFPHNIVKDGVNGMVINLLLNYFKENDIYIKKLHLSDCLQDNQISLSRLILTILREKRKNCSMVELFDCLSPFFNLQYICDVIYDMSEAKRDIWRRLLVISKKFPTRGVEDLYIQKDLYLKNDRSSEKYSMIELCTAGETYLETIVPHFEFMLSRHSEYDYSTNLNYHPLFSKTSEDIIEENSMNKYRFELKIDFVYNTVKDCCRNSRYMATKIMNNFDWDENLYLNYSYYNYRSKYSDGTFGYKQDYASRLIFGHIGYIERYRRYILLKSKSLLSMSELIDINTRLVKKIKRYLELYTSPQSDDYHCCHSKSQNEAAAKLHKSIKTIEDSHYKDFTTLIEIVKN